MRFLRRYDAGPASAWWNAVAEYPHAAPGIVRELLLSRSVACDPVEADQALAWARGASGVDRRFGAVRDREAEALSHRGATADRATD